MSAQEPDQKTLEIIRKAMMIAMMLPENQNKTTGQLRAAAVILFGEDNVANVFFP